MLSDTAEARSLEHRGSAGFVYDSTGARLPGVGFQAQSGGIKGIVKVVWFL